MTSTSKPRFYVASLTGYSLNGGQKNPRTNWYVLDRLYCCEIVSYHEVKAGNNQVGGNSDQRRGDAEKVAADLNRKWENG